VGLHAPMVPGAAHTVNMGGAIRARGRRLEAELLVTWRAVR
jgi:hypothetical protein